MIPANFVYGIFQSGYHRSSDPRYRPRRWSRYLGRHQPAGRLRQRQPRREVPGHEAAHGEVDVTKSRKEKHNPDGTGGAVKKYCENTRFLL